VERVPAGVHDAATDGVPPSLSFSIGESRVEIPPFNDDHHPVGLVIGSFCDGLGQTSEQAGLDFHAAAGKALLQMGVHECLEVQGCESTCEKHAERRPDRLTDPQDTQRLRNVRRLSPD
jgi:hypothetical protein